MKFAKEYVDVYVKHLPKDWPSIHYKQLKKSITKIVLELQARGLITLLGDAAPLVSDGDGDGEGDVSPTIGNETAKTSKKRPLADRQPTSQRDVSETHCTVDYVLQTVGDPSVPPLPFLVVTIPRSVSSSLGLCSLERTVSRETEETQVARPDVKDSILLRTARAVDIDSSIDDHPPLKIAKDDRSSKNPKSDKPGDDTKNTGFMFDEDVASTMIAITTSAAAATLSGALGDLNLKDKNTSTPDGTSGSQLIWMANNSITIEQPTSLLNIVKADEDLLVYNAGDTVTSSRKTAQRRSTAPSLILSKGSSPDILLIPIAQDQCFFEELNTEINDIADFKVMLRDRLNSRINAYLERLAVFASPQHGDIAAWRELMTAFMHANIWIPSSRSSKPMTAAEIRSNLENFLRNTVGHIANEFKSQKSRTCLKEFIQINLDLLQMYQFEEINQIAVRKALKKHDKRTFLSATPGFMKMNYLDSIFASASNSKLDHDTRLLKVLELSRALSSSLDSTEKCSCELTVRESGNVIEMSSFASQKNVGVIFADVLTKKMIFSVIDRLSAIIPQMDDYLCPICQDISWKPIRLECGHVFCVRCLVKAQARKIKHCPICRFPEAVERVTALNLDVARMNFLKLYFPSEIKKKAKDAGKEKAVEDMLRIFGSADGSGLERNPVLHVVSGLPDGSAISSEQQMEQIGSTNPTNSDRYRDIPDGQSSQVSYVHHHRNGHSSRDDACLVM